MSSLQESLASWATILGTALSILGLFQSRAWLVAISLVLVVASLAAVFFARKQFRRVKSATITIEGRRIDSLNLANLNRNVNRSLVIQEAEQVATINGEDLAINWRYAGYCGAEKGTVIEFSIDSDNNVPFERLECAAYDLRRDPDMQHTIRPILAGPDGNSKKIVVPFLEPLASSEAFNVLLKCSLPGCMKEGLEYYTSTLSFGQDQVRRSSVRLCFVGNSPEWIRVYGCDASGNVTLVKDLSPVRQGQHLVYTDLAENVAARSARIYTFYRRSK